MWQLLLQLAQQWSEGRVHGQAKKRARGNDLKACHVAPLDGLEYDDATEMLRKLTTKELTYQEFGQTCAHRKKQVRIK